MCATLAGTVALQRKLERIRRSWKDGRPPKFFKKTAPPPRAESEWSKCGPGGELREHPSIVGLRWLAMFGEALRIHGLVWSSRVSAEDWERDGCVSLYLQRVVKEEVPALAVSVGPAGMRTAETHQVPLGGGAWEKTRVPIGAVNNHDIRWVLAKVTEPKTTPLVLASSHILRAMEGF